MKQKTLIETQQQLQRTEHSETIYVIYNEKLILVIQTHINLTINL